MAKPQRILIDGTAVRSNLIARDTFPGDELTEQEKKEYEHLGDELDGHAFFRYKGNVYGLCDFTRTQEGGGLHQAGWSGMMSMSAFHGIVISLDQIQQVIVGEVFS